MSYIGIVRERILQQATWQEPFNKSSYVLNLIDNLEAELARSQPEKYVIKKPDAYPSTHGEASGFRQLVRPIDFVFKEVHWRLGDTELHLREANQPKNLQSLVVVCTGTEALKRPSEGSVVLQSTAELVSVCVHENGVISTILLAPGKVESIESWYADRALTLGSRPQAQTKGHFASIIAGSLADDVQCPEGVNKLWTMYSLVKAVVIKSST